MNPEYQPQPTPPPAAQQPLNTGQYDFITSPNTPQKKAPLIGFGTLKQKIILIGAAAGIFIVILLIFSLFGRNDNSSAQNLLSVARKQNQIITLAEEGTDKAGGVQAQNLALNTLLTIRTDQQAVIAQLAKAGKEVKAKDLAVGQDAKLTQELTTAETNGRFDEVFINILKAELTEYQSTLKTSFAATQNQTTRSILSTSNESVTLLLGSQTSGQ